LSGLTAVTTASPHNFDYLKSLGADAVYDYKSPTCAADIKKFTANKLTYAWDCTGHGAETCATALSDELPSKFGTIVAKGKDALQLQSVNPKIEGPLYTLGYDAIGEVYLWPDKPRSIAPDEYEFASKYWELTRELLAQGKIKAARTTVNRGGKGLGGVLVGLKEVENGKLSAEKLVYTL
jgi:NADPH:quinone reductase-like Zn-dependent oxidoreductase